MTNSSAPDPAALRVGIDIGGTFTDFVVHDAVIGAVRSFKRLSSPHDPAESVLAGLSQLPAGPRDIVHGSTVATNALLERKGAPTALITTRGFRDLLQIGRQNRPHLYDLFADPTPPLVPERWRFEVDERVTSRGEVLVSLDPAQAEALVPTLQAEGISSVAIGLLFSFLYPDHELTIARVLRAAGFPVSPSCEVLPEYREYERTSTTVINAYVSPVMDRYLARLESALTADNLRIMQSNGGAISVQEARRNAVRCILSGPAGGVVGARAVAAAAGWTKVITFDMGGTSTDVSLCDGELRTTSVAAVGGVPLRIPILDIHTVGSGGGSIAAVDSGGALRVGPASAGVDPGPACYGQGDLPTVTDANLVLGRLAPDHFLGGAMQLDVDRGRAAVGRLATSLGHSPQRAALGIIEVVNAHMTRALRVISVQRGHDPADFGLVPFGGAGGLHAADLARQLGIPRVLVSPHAATLSALGMLIADVVKDYVQTVMLPGDAPSWEIRERLSPLLQQAAADLKDQGIHPDQMLAQSHLDMRYRGQSYELTVPFSEGTVEAFYRAHNQAYGYADRHAPLEIVNLRVRAIGRVSAPPWQSAPRATGNAASALLDKRPVVLPSPGGAETTTIPFYLGDRLMSGAEIAGPAVVVRPDTTILIGRQDRAVTDGHQNLIIEVAPN